MEEVDAATFSLAELENFASEEVDNASCDVLGEILENPVKELRSKIIMRPQNVTHNRCEVCYACTRENCRKCVHCLDMKKYGGPGKVKQGCILRKCERILEKCSPNKKKLNTNTDTLLSAKRTRRETAETAKKIKKPSDRRTAEANMKAEVKRKKALVKKSGIRFNPDRCYDCKGCLRVLNKIDCKKCSACKDMKRCGGLGLLRTICRYKTCTAGDKSSPVLPAAKKVKKRTSTIENKCKVPWGIAASEMEKRSMCLKYYGVRICSLKRCYTCNGCQRLLNRTDCKKCHACTNKKKYGGPGTSHGVCLYKICTAGDKSSPVLPAAKKVKKRTSTIENKCKVPGGIVTSEMEKRLICRKYGVTNFSLKRCYTCNGCQRLLNRTDCKKCRACKNKKKYGGPGASKDICLKRLCTNPITLADSSPVLTSTQELEKSGSLVGNELDIAVETSSPGLPINKIHEKRTPSVEYEIDVTNHSPESEVSSSAQDASKESKAMWKCFFCNKAYFGLFALVKHQKRCTILQRNLKKKRQRSRLNLNVKKCKIRFNRLNMNSKMTIGKQVSAGVPERQDRIRSINGDSTAKQPRTLGEIFGKHNEEISQSQSSCYELLEDTLKASSYGFKEEGFRAQSDNVLDQLEGKNKSNKDIIKIHDESLDPVEENYGFKLTPPRREDSDSDIEIIGEKTFQSGSGVLGEMHLRKSVKVQCSLCGHRSSFTEDEAKLLPANNECPICNAIIPNHLSHCYQQSGASFPYVKPTNIHQMSDHVHFPLVENRLNLVPPTSSLYTENTSVFDQGDHPVKIMVTETANRFRLEQHKRYYENMKSSTFRGETSNSIEHSSMSNNCNVSSGFDKAAKQLTVRKLTSECKKFWCFDSSKKVQKIFHEDPEVSHEIQKVIKTKLHCNKNLTLMPQENPDTQELFKLDLFGFKAVNSWMSL